MIVGQGAILAAEEEQGFSIVNCGGFHFPDKNRVVAGDVRIHKIAGEVKERAFENRNAAGRPVIANGEALLGFGTLLSLGKVLGDGLLAVFQNADAKTFFLLEQGKQFRAVVHADRNQHRMERDGSKRVGGHAVHETGPALDGYHGYAGGKLAEGFAEFQSSGWRRGHLGNF